MKSPGTPQTVFIVDDEPAIRTSLQLLIEAHGMPVRTFPSAASFLDAYKPGETGCLLMDLRMPDMNGLDLQEELIRRSCALPIIVLTAFADVPSAIRALKSGAVEFLEKPVDDDVLLGHIRRALALDAERERRRNQDDLFRERFERLTRREREVLRLVVDGLSSKQIGLQLHVSTKTVEAHRLGIMRKMEADSIAGLVRDVVGFESRKRAKRAADS